MINNDAPKVYLSRRNLLVLLSKLDRRLAGEETAGAIIKNKQVSENYQQTVDTISVIAVEDEEYYSSQQRPAGQMLDVDEPEQDSLHKPFSIWRGI